MTLSPPTPVDWTARYQPAAADFNTNIRDTFDFLQAPPVFRAVIVTGGSTITSGSWFGLVFDTVREDNYSGYSGGEYVAQVPGWYLATFVPQLTITTGFPGAAGFVVENNGAPSGVFECGRGIAGFTPFTWQAMGMFWLAAGDWIQPQLRQDSGSNATIAAGTTDDNRCAFEVCWISE